MIPPPPSLSDLRAGTTLRAGLGYSTILTDMDFETYSEAGYVYDPIRRRWHGPATAPKGKRGLQVVDAARYSEHPTTEVLSLAYDLKEGQGRRLWTPARSLPYDLFNYLAAGGLIEAWNVMFERLIWENVCVARMGWPAIHPSQYRCAMAKARAFALPGGLEKAGEAIGATVRKNSEGKRLIARFSVPRNPTKDDDRLRLDPLTDPEGVTLYAYNLDDIAAEADISSRVPDLTPDELAWWQLDQEINRRGVMLDMPSVRACIHIVEQVLRRADAELTELTGGAVTAASEVQRLREWVSTGHGVYVDSLDEEALTGLLDRKDLPGPVRRALTIRQQASSASVKKLYAMENKVCVDDCLRDLYVWHGARTGRPTGSGVQPTNLPTAGPNVKRCGCGRHYAVSNLWCPWCGQEGTEHPTIEWDHRVVEDVLEIATMYSLAAFETVFSDPLGCIAGCLRGLFIARPGHEFISSDYSAIEAVVAAELAGEEWRNEVFRTHGKIYEMSAARASGVPFEEMMAHKARTGQHHPLRKKGKVMELALGYGGWTGSMIAFGADEFMTEKEMEDTASQWRRDSPSVVEMWGGQSRPAGYGRRTPELFGLEGAAIRAIYEPGTWFSHRSVSYMKQGDVLYCLLPSGRTLTYHHPRLAPSSRRSNEFTLSYEGWNTNPKNGLVGWIRIETYGPKMFENVVQAVARDIQVYGLLALSRAGYHIALHTYDEDTCEVRIGSGSLEEVERIMSTMPPWASGWSVRATGGWTGRRNRK